MIKGMLSSVFMDFYALRVCITEDENISLFLFVYSGNDLLQRNHSVCGENKKETGTAKISLIIALVFITCHMVKWVPNIHEIVMVRILICFFMLCRHSSLIFLVSLIWNL